MLSESDYLADHMKGGWGNFPVFLDIQGVNEVDVGEFLEAESGFYLSMGVSWGFGGLLSVQSPCPTFFHPFP